MYIIYKIINNLICLLKFRSRSIPLLAYSKFNFEKNYGFTFDFSHKTTHLGDRLFFFPLIRSLVELNIPIKVNDSSTNELFRKIYGIDVPRASSEHFIAIIPKPSFLRFLLKYKDVVLVDFTDLNVESKISLELISSFNRLFKLNLNANVDVNALNSSNYSSFAGKSLFDSKKYVVFNNYINSGFFRIYFKDSKLLSRECEKFRNNGFEIIHVGSKSDKKNDINKYDFVSLDFRGLLTMVELVELISLPNVFGVVTFDNFIMHLAHLFDKPSWILFRGRFLKRNEDHHMKYVNNTFLSNSNNINYL